MDKKYGPKATGSTDLVYLDFTHLFQKKQTWVKPVSREPMDLSVYRIPGLAPEKEAEAVRLLANGTTRSEVARRFGIALSDIVAINTP